MADTSRTRAALQALLADNTAGDISAQDLRDMLVSLNTTVGPEIAVTTTATLTINQAHVCSGTTSNYTVTLPAASGNAGNQVAIRMAPGLTKLVTVDGNGSETIDGSLTRIMWAGESAILECDGSNWFKVGGKSKAIGCKLYGVPLYFGVTSGVETTIGAWQTAAWDDVNGWNAANLYTVARPGRYRVELQAAWGYEPSAFLRKATVYAGSDSQIAYGRTSDPPSTVIQSPLMETILSAGDTCYGTAEATYGNLYLDYGTAKNCFLQIQELQPW